MYALAETRELTSLAEADRKIALDRYQILRPHSVPAEQRRRRHALCSGFEIARMVEIGNEPGLTENAAQKLSAKTL